MIIARQLNHSSPRQVDMPSSPSIAQQLQHMVRHNKVMGRQQPRGTVSPRQPQQPRAMANQQPNSQQQEVIVPRPSQDMVRVQLLHRMARVIPLVVATNLLPARVTTREDVKIVRDHKVGDLETMVHHRVDMDPVNPQAEATINLLLKEVEVMKVGVPHRTGMVVVHHKTGKEAVVVVVVLDVTAVIEGTEVVVVEVMEEVVEDLEIVQDVGEDVVLVTEEVALVMTSLSHFPILKRWSWKILSSSVVCLQVQQKRIWWISLVPSVLSRLTRRGMLPKFGCTKNKVENRKEKGRLLTMTHTLLRQPLIGLMAKISMVL